MNSSRAWAEQNGTERGFLVVRIKNPQRGTKCGAVAEIDPLDDGALDRIRSSHEPDRIHSLGAVGGMTDTLACPLVCVTTGLPLIKSEIV